MVIGLCNITWKQFRAIVKNKNFLEDIKNISLEDLRKRFKEYNIDPFDDELSEFKKIIIKIVECSGNMRTLPGAKRRLQEFGDDWMSSIIGGTNTNPIINFIALNLLQETIFNDSFLYNKPKYINAENSQIREVIKYGEFSY